MDISAFVTTAIHYTYDPLQRLTGASYSGAYTYTFAYAYDAVGNRTAQTQTITSTLVTTYTYDAANRLTAVNGQPYTWDNNGNLTNDGSKTYLYNQANQLITITATGLTWNAAYNGDGARLRQIANGVPTTYTLDLAAPLVTALTERTGATTKQYLYGLGDSPMAVYTGTAWTYLSGRDGLNSVRQETDVSGNVTSVRSFDPYGVPLDGNGGSPFGYTGEQTDATGLVFLRARYMQPGLGMFLSRDPWSGDALRPGSFNGWNYVECNPINMSDPLGLRPAGPDEIGDIREEIDSLVKTGELGAKYQYSCNCGWIDLGHALSGMQRRTSLSLRIFDRLKANIDWKAYPLWTGKRGIRVQSVNAIWGIPFTVVDDIAAIPESNLSNRPLLPRIAAGIFIEHSERVEQTQFVGTSNYSEEDLPSDLIGLYMATRMEEGVSYQSALEEIINLCDVVSKQESLDVYKNEYRDGDGFLTGWKRWDARLMSMGKSCITCDSQRQWPSQFSDLTNSAVHSNRNNGIWWWHQMFDELREQRRTTNVEGVYTWEKRWPF